MWRFHLQIILNRLKGNLITRLSGHIRGNIMCFCAIFWRKVYEPFFGEAIKTNVSHPDALLHLFVTQMQDEPKHFIWQPDSVLPRSRPSVYARVND